MGGGIQAQQTESATLMEGNVSFISSRNVYVKFKSTLAIQPKDTLFIRKSDRLIPMLIVTNKSSSSTVCTLIGPVTLRVNDSIVARLKPKVKKNKPVDKLVPEPKREIVLNDPVIKPAEDQIEEVLFKEKIKGRVSVASYNNLSGFNNTNRMRYAFSLRGYHLNDSRYSVESYVTFRHQLNDSINFAEALKVYTLSVKHDFDKNTSLTFGRKINPKFSSMGAIDGLQFEKGVGNFDFGVIAGSRPDLRNYGLNLNLLQFGAYASVSSSKPGSNTQTTLGFIEQTNTGRTDRRFMYVQHSSNLGKNLHLFSSFEIDLFENINDQVNNNPQLTNLYLSLRYRVSRKLRLSASYDNRRNIIYYETYKNLLDQLIEDESRQGFRFSLNHRLNKHISWGANTGMRFQKSQRNPSRNFNGHVTFNNVPHLKARVTLRANYLQTDFLDSQIFDVRFGKKLAKNKVEAEVYYRWVDYKYQIGDRVLHQNIAGANVSVRIQRNLSLHLFYEGVFDNLNQSYHRFNTRIIKRF